MRAAAEVLFGKSSLMMLFCITSQTSLTQGDFLGRRTDRFPAEPTMARAASAKNQKNRNEQLQE
jgi:hypothetical protein